MSNYDIIKPLRSLLFVPGNHLEKVEKVFKSGADAVILDLEDAVAIKDKNSTRKLLPTLLEKHSNDISLPIVYVRVNGLDTDYCFEDLTTLVGPYISGVMLPKVEEVWQIPALDWLLTQLEKKENLQNGSIDLLPIIETAKGIASIDKIAESAKSTRVKRLTFGAGDLTTDMNMRWTVEENELHHIRGRVALACNASQLEPPIDTVYLRLDDDDGFKSTAIKSRDLGFFGKLCIHPKQVPIANEAFTPTAQEIQNATMIVSAFNEAEKKGSASIKVNGRFVDYPVVSAAKRTLALMKAISKDKV
tara:strand:+ start:54356 stop:55267 length:912 start_codon:yes stop_codon:yes gene_type:complete